MAKRLGVSLVVGPLLFIITFLAMLLLFTTLLFFSKKINKILYTKYGQKYLQLLLKIPSGDIVWSDILVAELIKDDKRALEDFFELVRKGSINAKLLKDVILTITDKEMIEAIKNVAKDEEIKKYCDRHIMFTNELSEEYDEEDINWQ